MLFHRFLVLAAPLTTFGALLGAVAGLFAAIGLPDRAA